MMGEVARQIPLGEAAGSEAWLAERPSLSLVPKIEVDRSRAYLNDPDGEVAQIYKAVARQVAVKIAAKAKDFSSKFPTIKVSKDT